MTNLQQAFGPADEGPAVVFTKDIAETVVNGTYKFLLNLQQQMNRGRDLEARQWRSTSAPGPRREIREDPT